LIFYGNRVILLTGANMRKRVYIETTIPSFYYEVRKEPEMIARRNWTREWWNRDAQNYELVNSEPVLDELKEGLHPNKKLVTALLKNIPIVSVEPEIADIVRAYIRHKVMPSDPVGDALHLALASYHKCDFLLTWNCNHLANANKFFHIRRVNTLISLFTPNIVTPFELLGG
jgi:predicted nucleic acid-binding protein